MDNGDEQANFDSRVQSAITTSGFCSNFAVLMRL